MKKYADVQLFRRRYIGISQTLTEISFSYVPIQYNWFNKLAKLSETKKKQSLSLLRWSRLKANMPLKNRAVENKTFMVQMENVKTRKINFFKLILIYRLVQPWPQYKLHFDSFYGLKHVCQKLEDTKQYYRDPAGSNSWNWRPLKTF